MIRILLALAASASWLQSTKAAPVVNYQAPQLVSENGLLNITISIDNRWSLNNKRYGPAYNDGPVGPTIRLKPGDTFIVNLVNKLPPESAYAKELRRYISDPTSNLNNVTIIENRLSEIGEFHKSKYGYWGQNFMNLHFHGARRDARVENITYSLDGGESRTYVHKVTADTPPIFSWYHNHHHGTAVYSYFAGLFGALIIEGTPNDLKSLPEIAGAKELILILSESYVDANTSRPMDWISMVDEFGWDHVTNGHLGDDTVYEFTTGETAFFRLIGSTVEQNIQFSIDNHTLMAVAYDGYPVTTPLKMEKNLTLDSGSRVEFLVKFDRAGTYKFRRAAWNHGETGLGYCKALYGLDQETCISWDQERIIATIVVSDGQGTVKKQDLPTTLPNVVHPSLTAAAFKPSVGRRVVSFTEGYDFPLFQIPYEGPFRLGSGYGMNNKFFNSRTTSGEVEAGTCETWIVSSNAPDGEHPFHVHGTPYLITKIGAVSVQTPFWRDTYAVRTLDIEIKVCFPNKAGPLLVHCHMATHLDVGMATYYNIIPSTRQITSAPVTVSPTSVPTLPITPAPVLPVTRAPTLLVTPAPILPVTPAPVLPVTRAPTLLVTPAPILPVTAAPVLPITQAPVLPITPAPVLPVTPAPVLPVTPAPVLPVTPAPALPMTPAPVLPVTLAPTLLVTPAPIVPVTPAPVLPVTRAPTLLVTPAPILPVTAAPVLPITPAPVLPVTPAPVLPVTPAPVLPVTPAPVLPVTSAPVLPVTPAPVLPLTPSPAIPVTSAPVQRGGGGGGSSKKMTPKKMKKK